MRLREQIKQDAGREIGEFFGGAMGLAAKAGEINAEAIVVTLDGESVGLALQVPVLGLRSARRGARSPCRRCCARREEVAHPSGGPFRLHDPPASIRRLSWEHDQQPTTASRPFFLAHAGP